MMKQTSRRVAIVSVGLAVLIWAFVIFRGLTDDGDIPIHNPDEAMRVFHPRGFSAIHPKGWGPKIYQDSPGSLPPEIVIRSERGDFVWEIIQLRKRPALDSYRSLQFQGRDAWIYQTVTPRVVLDRRRESRTRIVFQREGTWYALAFAMHGEYEEIPQILWEYFDSFRCEKVGEGSAPTIEPGHSLSAQTAPVQN